MWFFFAVICLLSWGCADLFYKKSADADDGLSHLKTAVCVGLVMGVCSLGILLFTSTRLRLLDLLRYSPASAMYILSMVIGYAGLRYLEVSVTSPVQNSSGAISAVLFLIFLSQPMDTLTLVGTVVITYGIVLLAVFETYENRAALHSNAERKAASGALALLFPLAYCLFDTLGTFADGVILGETEAKGIFSFLVTDMGELEVLCAYGITFFAFGLCCWLYMLLFKKQRYVPFTDGSNLLASAFEMGGQFFYVYAMAARPAAAAPLVSSYCIVSLILGRLFLKERLTLGKNIAVGLCVIGIVIMGFSV